LGNSGVGRHHRRRDATDGGYVRALDGEKLELFPEGLAGFPPWTTSQET